MPDEWIKCPKCGNLIPTRYGSVRCITCGSSLLVENREQKHQREAEIGEENEVQSNRIAFSAVDFVLFIVFAIPILGLVEYFKPPLSQQIRWIASLFTAGCLSTGLTYLIFQVINRKKYPDQAFVDLEHIQFISFAFFYVIGLCVIGGIALNAKVDSDWIMTFIFLVPLTISGVISYLIKKLIIYFSR